MMKKYFGFVSAAGLVGMVALVGCTSTDPAASSSSGGAATTDGGKDATAPKPKTDAGTTAEPSSVGKECTTNEQCTDGTDEACGNAAFTEPLMPTPAACVGPCTPVDPTKIESCGNDQGVCLSTGSGGGVCFGACDFDETGVKTKCAGKAACNPMGFGKDSAGKVVGVGYCFGGCRADADCGGTNKCDTFSGLCYKAAKTYAKAVGAACDNNATTDECACRATSAAPTQGTCGQACVTGSSTCPAGFYCNAVPAKATDGSTLFTTEPAGIEGNCSKECTADTDCNPGWKCKDAPGGKKVCDI